MMATWKIAGMLPILSICILAAGNEIETIRQYPFDSGAGKVILSNSFESRGELPAKLPRGYSFVPGGGRNGTGALLYERTDPKLYTSLEFPIPEVSGNQTYEAEVHVRGENIRTNGDDKLVGGICVE